jgi:hypothetical protein
MSEDTREIGFLGPYLASHWSLANGSGARSISLEPGYIVRDGGDGMSIEVEYKVH